MDEKGLHNDLRPKIRDLLLLGIMRHLDEHASEAYLHSLFRQLRQHCDRQSQHQHPEDDEALDRETGGVF